MLKFTSIKLVDPLRHAGHPVSSHIILRGSEPQWVSGLKLCIEISSQVTPSTLPPPTTLTRKCPRRYPIKDASQANNPQYIQTDLSRS